MNNESHDASLPQGDARGRLVKRRKKNDGLIQDVDMAKGGFFDLVNTAQNIPLEKKAYLRENHLEMLGEGVALDIPVPLAAGFYDPASRKPNTGNSHVRPTARATVPGPHSRSVFRESLFGSLEKHEDKPRAAPPSIPPPSKPQGNFDQAGLDI